MKTVTALAAIAIVGCAMAAAEQPAAPTATPVKHPSLKVCNKQADAKQLTGEARSQFVKDCHAGKTSAKASAKSGAGGKTS
jgi:psiF repeat-containing protein